MTNYKKDSKDVNRRCARKQVLSAHAHAGNGPTPKICKKGSSETKTRRAKRVFVQQMDAIRTDMEKLKAGMSETLAEFRAKPQDAEAFKEEMQLVQKRIEWLGAVLDTDESQLTKKIQEQLEPAKTSDGGSIRTGSRDEAALARAGPCAGFENLKTLAYIQGLGSSFRACLSQQDIKSKAEEIAPHKKQVLVLASACKTAVNELSGAKKRAETTKEKQREKELKEAQQKKNKDPSKSGLQYTNKILKYITLWNLLSCIFGC